MRTGWVVFWLMYFVSGGLAALAVCTSGAIEAGAMGQILWAEVGGLSVFAVLVCVAGSVCIFNGSLVGFHPSVNSFSALGFGVGLLLCVAGWIGWVTAVARTCLGHGPMVW